MEETSLYLVAALVICFPASSHSQLYTLITPNVLRVETEEKVVIEAHGLSSPTNVTVTVYDSLQARSTLCQVSTTLNNTNGMMVTPTIKILAKDLKMDTKQNQYVTIRAQSSRFQLEKLVLVSVHSGYIFIQTDKTIYTPGSIVRYRIFAVGHSLEPLTKTVVIEVETPEGTVVSQNTVVSSANLQPYRLPEIVREGTWKIVAKYQDSLQQTFAAQFDVKKYVLPSFEVIVEAPEKFFYIDDNRDFRVSITARFLYGKKVEGVAFVLFGVQMNKEKISIPDSLRRILIEEGEGEALLTKAMLQSRFQNLTELVGHFLYVSVTVMTESGSDMVVTEQSGIGIVTSPYEIHFTKTSKYFKPGMPYELMTYVSNPDGSPAPNVPVTAEIQDSTVRDTATTQSDGTAIMTLNMPSSRQPQSITVKTNHEMLPKERQAKKTMVTTPYETQGGSGNFLHIAITATEIRAGDRLRINFIINNQRIQSQYFTYIIMSKGKIFKAGRQPREVGQTLVTMSLSITPDLIPSFRIVAYYQVGKYEIVADSVWVDVKDTCMGTLVVKGASKEENRIHEPGTSMEIKLEGDANARVALVAVDKGVFVLNKKHKFTQTKIWDTVEKNDIGCTAGSGRNNLGVFADAGLALQTSNQISTSTRSDPKCPQPARRKRRSMQLIESKASKVAQYEDRVLKKCCEDGMYENPMGYSCEKRAQYILEQNSCKDAFLECCRFIKSIRDEKQREEHLILARSDFEDDFLSDDEILSRTEFPESWLWQTEQLPPNEEGISSKTLSLFLMDSITTWEVLAVSISDKKGICVADPYEIIVMKDFFIDLRLPYSVVRNEQVEIRAILYNYRKTDIRVRVELIHNPAFCSASTAKKRYRQELTVKGQSSRAVPLVIIPLELGLHDLEVKANVRGQFVGDGVRKKLKVVPEGMLIYLTKNIDLNPATHGIDGVQQETIRANDLEDMVPNTEPETKISILGNPVAQLTEYSIDGSKLSQLLIIPSGCVEQNLIRMTPSVIATYYLDNTGQWEKIGIDRRAEAIRLVMTGYTQQLAYKESDYSYRPLGRSLSGTWITAYIAKVFAMASRVANIDSRNICGSVKWLLLNRQAPDGMFQEAAPVGSKSLTGGYQYGEPKVSLTAFVLITLLESRDICRGQVDSLENSISRATDYLSRKYDSLKNIYSVALTSYALALAGRLNDDRTLMNASTDGIRWEDPNYLGVSVESTSYALLTLLKMKKFDNVDPIAKWLTTQKNYGGTYGDTQSTIMVFQALAQYQIDAASMKGQTLDVSILLPERSSPVVFRIEDENALVAKSTETKWNEEFTVRATGEGQGTMTVTTAYHAKLRKEAAPCRNFDLQVSVEPVQLGNRESKGALGAAKIKICTRYTGDIDATMTIIDVSMLTGFSPDIEDLKRLSEGVDQFISKFEIDNIKSERGNIILYLHKVSHTEDECLHFKVYKYFEVGLVQPASVKVYSYYALEDQCTKFYHPAKSSGLLNKICHGDTCRCAEENCSTNKKDSPVNLQTRIEETCQPGVDYVYKTRLIRIEEENSYDNYIMEVLEILKAGSDRSAQAKPRKFISHMKCKESLQMEENKNYLIWGPATDIWATKSDPNYIIGEDTWIEKWPNEEECEQDDMEELCNEFVEFYNFLTIMGCQH
ncbi:A.superbus venom factor 1-like [Tiliqua scincoides]|uniref:A.superbus venom factor 1-like n=1 Tax=Tiliqua scincoides TaxID=71010 RepID=UPI0034629554